MGGVDRTSRIDTKLLRIQPKRLLTFFSPRLLVWLTPSCCKLCRAHTLPVFGFRSLSHRATGVAEKVIVDAKGTWGNQDFIA